MKIHTYRRKLREAEYFHSQILDHYGEDTEVCGYYLNVFILSCRSSLDYVIQDFLYSLKVYDMKTRDFKNKEKRQKKFTDHPKFDFIEKFVNDYTSKMEELYEDPEMNYFLKKRNTFMHQREDSIKSYYYIKKHGSSTANVNDRRLEGGIDYHLHPEWFKDLEDSDEIFKMAPEFKELIRYGT